MTLKGKLQEYIKKNKSMTREELAMRFEIYKDERKDFYSTLKQMEKEGLIFRNKKDKYVAVDNKYQVMGRLQGNEKGFGFLIPEDSDVEDIYIDSKNMNSALNGDTVLVNILPFNNNSKKTEGEVIRILERANKIIVGTYENQGAYGFVIPDESKISKDIFVPKDKMKGAKDGQKVCVEIEKWEKDNKNPEGKIVEILGFPDEKGVDILSIAKSMQLPMKFTKKTLREAENIDENLEDVDLDKFVDYRDKTIFTIDGKDSKDFDDAVSIDKLGNGNYVLGVHIANVAYYVKENSEIDKEAYNRGNSVYLIDKVIPMLPEVLSNGICSLNPNVDRICISVMMEINALGKVVKHTIEESVIKSKARLVYDHVTEFLEENKSHESLKEVENDLLQMAELAKILRTRRIDRGAIDFDFPEMEIEVDENGRPVEIKRAKRGVANRLIEEFMLVCNETVAEQFYWLELPFIFRVHEDPESEKISALNKTIRAFGYKIKSVNDVQPRDVQAIVEAVDGSDKEVFINTLILRSLKKARYAPECLGHFGLAAKFYTHFTSPIRRYSDLVIHRIIRDFIHNKLTDKKLAKLEESLPDITKHVSNRERIAQEAEREVMDIKAAQYMEGKIGEEYKGFISSVTKFGLFVQLENTIEGLVSYNKMEDYYIFDQDNYKAIGEKTGKEYTLGDKVRIKVVAADPAKGTVDFMIVSDEIGEE